MPDTDTQGQNTDTQAPEWLQGFPEEARKDPEVVKYKSPEEFYKGYRNKTEMLGRKGIIIPKEGDAPEVAQKYREALGIPDAPDKYVFKAPDKLHPSLKVSPDFEKDFKTRMHAKGVPQGQANALYQEYLSEVSNAMSKQEAAQEEARKAGLTKLNQEWGKDTESNIAMARKAAEKVLGPDGLNQLGDFANNPAAIRLLHGLTKMLSEDAILSIGGVEAAGAASADKEIRSIMSVPKDQQKGHPYWDETHPNHSEEVARVRDLYKKREARSGQA
jgi:hypothetical protein